MKFVMDFCGCCAELDVPEVTVIKDGVQQNFIYSINLRLHIF